MQLLTAQQTHLILVSLQWGADHAIIPIAIWLFHRGKSFLGTLENRVVDRTAESVQAKVDIRIRAHEAEDHASFARLGDRLTNIDAALLAIAPLTQANILQQQADIIQRLSKIETILRSPGTPVAAFDTIPS